MHEGSGFVMEDRLVPMIDHEPRRVVVVVDFHWSNRSPPPFLTQEPLPKLHAVHDFCSSERCTARDDEDASVEVVACRALEVVALQVHDGDVVEQSVLEAPVLDSLHPLHGSHQAHERIFEGRECVLEERDGPEDMVVRIADDGRFHFLDGVYELRPFVREVDCCDNDRSALQTGFELDVMTCLSCLREVFEFGCGNNFGAWSALT